MSEAERIQMLEAALREARKYVDAFKYNKECHREIRERYAKCVGRIDAVLNSTTKTDQESAHE